jgi:hypothetical protein
MKVSRGAWSHFRVTEGSPDLHPLQQTKVSRSLQPARLIKAMLFLREQFVARWEKKKVARLLLQL